MMDRLRELRQRFRTWVQHHPWTYSILAGIWTGIVFAIGVHILNNDSVRASAAGGLIMGIYFTLVARVALWMQQRRQQNPPGRRRQAWETAFLVGVLGWLAAWNVIVFGFGFDTSFAIVMGVSIAVGIIVTLLVHQFIVTRKPSREDLQE